MSHPFSWTTHAHITLKMDNESELQTELLWKLLAYPQPLGDLHLLSLFLNSWPHLLLSSASPHSRRAFLNVYCIVFSFASPHVLVVVDVPVLVIPTPTPQAHPNSH